MNGYGLVRKQLGRKVRKGRRYRRRTGVMRLQRQPRTFFGGKTALHRAEIGVPVYIYASTGPSYLYSFSPNTNQYLFTCWSVLGAQYATDISNMFNSYMYYRIKGMQMSFSRSINAAVNTVYQLPAFYVDLVHETNATANTYMNSQRWAAESDTALEILPLTTSSYPQQKYYSYGNDMFISNSGDYSGGKGAWISTILQPQHQLVLGWLDAPTLSGISDSPKVGTITVKFYFEFCKRGRIHNY